MKTLLIIDVQNDFLPGGSLAVPEGNLIIERINDIMKDYDLIVATKDWHPKDHVSFASNHHGKKVGDSIKVNENTQILWPDHCIQNDIGSEFPKELNSEKINKIIYKGSDKNIDSYSGFYDNDKKLATELNEYLKNKRVEKVDCVGLATEYCVKFTAIDSIREGFYTRVISKCTKGLIEEDIKNSIDEMRSLGNIVI